MTRNLGRVLGLLLWAASSEAALIVSGDGNISNPLSSSAFDNDTFFINILQGGTSVLVDDSSIGVSATIDAFYNSVAGVTSTELAGELTAASLAGVDLFISPASKNMYSAAEIAVLAAFFAEGGSLFLMSEYSFFSAQIENVNAVLSALGSGMSVSAAAHLCGFNTLTGDQIAADPLTAGVTSLRMACTSEVLGGTPLFFVEPGVAMIAYEAGPVPEPGTLGLLAAGLAGLLARKVRRTRRGSLA